MHEVDILMMSTIFCSFIGTGSPESPEYSTLLVI